MPDRVIPYFSSTSAALNDPATAFAMPVSFRGDNSNFVAIRPGSAREQGFSELARTQTSLVPLANVDARPFLLESWHSFSAMLGLIVITISLVRYFAGNRVHRSLYGRHRQR